MYRSQFRPDRFKDQATADRRTGRGTHHWVVSGGRASAVPGARPRSPPNRRWGTEARQAGRPGSVQQYRPRSPACVVPQGDATNYDLVATAADADTHNETMNRASSGSSESQKPSNVPDQSDSRLNLGSTKGARAVDSSNLTIHSEGYSSTAFTLQFGTLCPGVINKECIPCTISATPDLNEKHEKAHDALSSDKPNIVSLPPDREQQKQEATDDLVIGSLIDKYDCMPATVSLNTCVVPGPELPQTPVLTSVTPADKVCTVSCKVLPRSRSSPTLQQCQKQEVRKDVINPRQSYPATKPNISMQIPASYTPNKASQPFMLPVPARPLPLASHQEQPQVPVEFRGPAVHVQSIGSASSSLPVKMAAPVGNTPHMPPYFVHGAQPRALQQQSFIHQGHRVGYVSPASHHLPQLGNMTITRELSKKQPRICDEQKRPIKITNPETREELMLNRHGHYHMDVPFGQMPLHDMNLAAPTYPPLHNVYYPFRPNIYNTGHIYIPDNSTVPLTSRQMCSKVQPPRHGFDPTASNHPITSIESHMPNPWFDASSRPMTNLYADSEISNFKGLLTSTISAPGQGAPKPPTIFIAEKNEASSQTSVPTCMAESALSSEQRVHQLRLEIPPESEKVVSVVSLKIPAAISGTICSMSPQSVSTQQAQAGPASVGYATSISGPQINSAFTSSVKAKPFVMEESPVPAATSSSDAKGQLPYIMPLQSEEFLSTEASTGSDNVTLTVPSLRSSNLDETSLGGKNSKYEGSSILGNPPLIYTQEHVLPQFPSSRTFNEGSKARVNQHIVNAELMCSKYKAEHVNVTMPGAASSGPENGSDVGELVRFHACAESSDWNLSLSTGDLPPSNENNQPSPGAQIGACEPENKMEDSILDSARWNTALFSNSSSFDRKMEHVSSDLNVSNRCSAAAVSMVQTNNLVLEGIKTKSTHGRRKKRKAALSKADRQKSKAALSKADGQKSKAALSEADGKKSYDIYSVSGSFTENFVSSSTEEVEMGTSTGGNDNQNKSDFFHWEGETEISCEKLRVYGCKHSNNGVEVNRDSSKYDQKRYSRDFLLTFARSCINLPENFKIGSDISDAILHVRSEDHPNQARIKGRVSATSHGNRHTASNKLDENTWRKSFPSVSGRDPIPDSIHRPAFSSWDAQHAARGFSRSVSQNKSSRQHTGEILSRAMREVVCQRSKSSGSFDERWQHRTNIQGMRSPPQVSMPLMHKAEKKYEIGKVSDEEEAKQRQLKAILNKLTPQNFEKLIEQVKDLNIDNMVTLNGVISQIFDKALMEPTFCEMYASFCSSLAGELPNFVKDGEKITFKGLLLNKCQEEFERGEREQAEADRVKEKDERKQFEGEKEEKRLQARRRMLGNIRLIGELYKKKMLTERIMHECIMKLLGEYQQPDEEDLEALCKLMSTIGEMIDHSMAKVYMEFYFDIIHKLSANSKLSSRIRFMLEDVIDLRKNKWKQRRKVEGPKKIEEVRRDAVKQKISQSIRSGSSPNCSSSATCISPALRPGPPPEHGVRGSSAFASRGSSQGRAIGSQNINLDTRYHSSCAREKRYQSSYRALSVPLHRRSTDKSICLSPQGDLGKEMSLCGKPPVSSEILPEVSSNSHNGQTSQNSRQGSFTGVASNQTNSQATDITPKSQSWGAADHALPILVTAVNPVSQMHTPSTIIEDMCSEARTFPQELLQEKAIITIKEFYRAKGEKEVRLCMKELNAASFCPSLISLWINDSFERKDLERELLAKLLVNLCKSQESVLSQRVLLQGFQHVVSTLEDAVTDAPKATEFLGRIFAKVILEDVLSLTEIGLLLQDGGEELAQPASDQRLASEVLGSMLESIRVERGDSAVDEIRAKSNLHLENLRRPGLCV